MLDLRQSDKFNNQPFPKAPSMGCTSPNGLSALTCSKPQWNNHLLPTCQCPTDQPVEHVNILWSMEHVGLYIMADILALFENSIPKEEWYDLDFAPLSGSFWCEMVVHWHFDLLWKSFKSGSHDGEARCMGDWRFLINGTSVWRGTETGTTVTIFWVWTNGRICGWIFIL